MKVSELKAGANSVEVEGTITEKSEPRKVVTKYGKMLSVCDAVFSDDTGSITLSLWEDNVNLVNVGDKVKITNGYVSEFRGSPQLSTGKYGKIEVTEKAS